MMKNDPPVGTEMQEKTKIRPFGKNRNPFALSKLLIHQLKQNGSRLSPG